MGYYTSYQLNIDCAQEDAPAILQKLEELDVFETLDSWKGGVCGYAYCKWYDWADDMLRFSTECPEAFITLEGDGEGSDDFWRAYIKNGAMQECPGIITYDDYDPEKMRQRRDPTPVGNPVDVSNLI